MASSDSEQRAFTAGQASSSSELQLCSSPYKRLDSPDLELCSSPCKRPKTLTLSPKFTSKGKEKVDEIKDENEDGTMDSYGRTCGICFSDDGKAIRGRIDSCDHYFCFVCVMEWSKIESRCPLCKRRFSTIRRPPKDGVFLRERVVNVPVRDQVYHPLGNATTGPSDPYAEAQCSECHSTADESLLLLCDLCDSAAHTYCVGLGATVPEGDWYCRDCAVSRDYHTSSQPDDDFGNKKFSRNFDTHVGEASVSIFDIVRESNSPEVDRTPRRASAHPDQVSCPIAPYGDISVGSRVTDSGARTLHRCRNVHSHIRTLRENWNALRSGSLGFSSSLPDSAGKSNTKGNIMKILSNRSSHLKSSSSMNCQQMPSKDSVLSDTLGSRGSHDIDKAWKLLDIAKSIQKTRAGTSIGHQASLHPSIKRHASKETTNVNSKSRTTNVNSKSKVFVHKDLVSIAKEKNKKCHTIEMAQEKYRSQKSEKQKPSRNMMKVTAKFNEGSPTTHLSARPVQTSVQIDVSQKHVGEILHQVLHGAFSNLTNGIDESACSMTLVDSLPRGYDPTCSRPMLGASSGHEAEPPRTNDGLEQNLAESTERKNDDAKSEIQSLVKLNLKLLSRDKKLGVDRFKEVARLATHTILAACGLKHTESSVRPFPNSICSHAAQIPQLRMSNLMPSSCRECFYVFVKDVVNSIMAEKKLL